MKRILIEIMQIILAIVFIGGGLVYFGQESMIFYPQPVALADRTEFSKYEVEFEKDDVTLRGWFVKNEISARKPLIVYYGGNAEEVSPNLLYQRNYLSNSFLFVNYRGYGDSEGSPGEKVLLDDALFILDTLVERETIPLQHIVLLGRSLGSGVATYIASERSVRGVILVTPFDSLEAVAKYHYSSLPVSFLLKHPFRSDFYAPKIDTPALYIIGKQDQVIPNENSQRLAKLWGGEVSMVAIDDADHNNISNFPQYWSAVNQFLQKPSPDLMQ